jgi:3-oxoacyl-[acyl-carrier protein] reductase
MSEPMFDKGAALIFGGSGGVGQGVCPEFAKAGSNVAITYYKQQGVADQLAGELAQHGVKASAHQVAIGRCRAG